MSMSEKQCLCVVHHESSLQIVYSGRSPAGVRIVSTTLQRLSGGNHGDGTGKC